MTPGGWRPVEEGGRRQIRLSTYFIFFAAAASLVILSHWHHWKLPFFWDEVGLYIPASLDLLRDGAWVPQSTAPTLHPPAIEAFLAVTWKIFGYSILSTRLAMLLMASTGVFVVFLLAIELCRGFPGVPAFGTVFFLIASPIFYTQAMMAQLDMPAMLFTALALLLFLQDRYGWSAVVCTILVLFKETGLAVPAVFGAWLLLRERNVRPALYFLVPLIPLIGWMPLLKQSTGHLLGDPYFSQYNVGYALHPVRIVVGILRRLYYIFISEFRWIGAIGLLAGWRSGLFASRKWAITALVFVLNGIIVTVFGGATLERYLLPLLPLAYIAMAAGWALWLPAWRRVAQSAMFLGLIASLFWNPPYPFPYENNLAMADCVNLFEAAAEYLDEYVPRTTVATAWPMTAVLHTPDYGYVRRSFPVIDTADFRPARIRALDPAKFDVLVVYSRTWEPDWSVLHSPAIAGFLRKFYDYEPQIGADEIRRQFGFRSLGRWTQHGLWIEIFANPAIIPRHQANPQLGYLYKEIKTENPVD